MASPTPSWLQHPAFEGLEQAEEGLALSVWKDGQEMFSEAHGHANPDSAWEVDTISWLWSATKPLAAWTLLKVWHEAGLRLDDCIAEVWPAFGQQEKDSITLRQLLAHEAGLPVLDPPVPSITDWAGVGEALAQQKPVWTPGSAHGYHARTFGFLCGHTVEALTKKSFQEVWQEQIGGPYHLDISFGHASSVPATLRAPRALSDSEHDRIFYSRFAKPDSLTQRTFQSPSGLNSPTSLNLPGTMEILNPSFGAVGSARDLAKFYMHLMADCLGLSWLQEVLGAPAPEIDKVLGVPTRYALGLMVHSPLALGSFSKGFGHPGAGGMLGMADPETGCAVGLIRNGMQPGLFPSAAVQDWLHSLVKRIADVY
ncbi:MAG: serine hydrolase domain-containing protein [Verrucomicrobiales bacterium]